MRKIILAASTAIPALMLATTLAAQNPIPPQGGQQGASPSTESPSGSGSTGGTEQSGASGAGSAKGAKPPPEAGGAQKRPDATGGERAQDNQPPMKRQQSGAGTPDTQMQKQGKTNGKSDTSKSEGGTSTKQMQGTKRTEPATGNAQGQEQQKSTGQNTQRSTTGTTQNTQTKEGGTTTQQRTGTGQNVDTTTTGSVNISSEKRTTIRETITREHVTPIRDVNFSVNVGVAVPRTVELRPLPARVIEIVPQYRTYRFFVLADGRIVIVEPDTYKIVYIITA